MDIISFVLPSSCSISDSLCIGYVIPVMPLGEGDSEEVGRVK